MTVTVDLRVAAVLITIVCSCLLYIVIPAKPSQRKRENLDLDLAKEFEKENWIRERIYQYRLGYYHLEDFDYLKDDFKVDIEKHCGNSGERAAAETEYHNYVELPQQI